MHEQEDVEMVSCDQWRCDEQWLLEDVENGEADCVHVEHSRYSECGTEGVFCTEHTHSCDNCDTIVHSDDVYPVQRLLVCRDCLMEYYYCEGCDQWHYPDDVEYDDNTGETYCSDCYRERRPQPRERGTAHCCSTERVHFDLLTERFLCDCEADKLTAPMVLRRDQMKRMLTNV